jgi:CDP-glycerol glycerophosphotransferase (TagB/SpsB family)
MIVFIIKKVIAFVVNAFGAVIPKDKKLVFVCDADARRDNAWAMASALSGRDVQVVYYTKDISAVKPLNGVRYTANRKKALWAFLRAYTVLWAYGPLRQYLKPRRGQRVINLWHGSPLKDISFLADTKQKFALKDSFTAVLSPSAFFDPIMMKSFECGGHQILRLGAPRNDWLFSTKDAAALLGLPPKAALCVWMPTFRNAPRIDRMDSNIEFPLIDADNIAVLDDLIGRYGFYLIIKPHPAAADVSFLHRDYKHIRVCFNDDLARLDLEIYELLGRTDLLLTDYSSVTFDFLLTGKPLGFIVDDMESYGKERGFTVADPLSLMPGANINDLDGLEALLRNLSEGKDGYEEERSRVCTLANDFTDGQNCKRLLEHLGL